ncbi:hypothetical protein EB75_03530 [Mycobacterium sp. ST-F2]|jgi:hypothetical protein|uniref:hypothetical protein n=1 Tax=Mycobacterium sp. ST-F2 TaxID=1490484 RepID=UPI00093C7172|nr:hypothetical protein [Mycobacterium sp. ST-F2]OKH84601.1 hypothetical protein EB75_03530 [Mycobacterium sp. ST-F2]
MLRLVVVIAVVILVLAILAFIAGASALTATASALDRKKRGQSFDVKQSLSHLQIMAGAWILAFIAVIGVGIATDGAGLLPTLGVSAIGLAITHGVTSRRAMPSGQSPKAAVATRQSRQALERAELTKKLGASGVALLDGAEAAIDRIKHSEAASEGWLGDPEDLDFTEDLAMIRENSRTTMELNRLIEESSNLPDPTPSDIAMIDDARTKVKQLQSRSRSRVKALRECADKAEQIDQSLQDEREQARIAEQRDDVRSRLAAQLYGVEAAQVQEPSPSLDKTSALAAAYIEIRGSLGQEPAEPLHEADSPSKALDSTAKRKSKSDDDFLDRAWKWLTE